MSSTPKIVADAFKRVSSGKEGIYLNKINGKYYVYKHVYEWDKEKKRSITRGEYLGRITTTGIFIPKENSYKDDFERAKLLIAERGGEIVWHNKNENNKIEPVRSMDLEEVDLKILMALSMNSRIATSKLSKMIGRSPITINARIKKLEDKLNIRYLLEIRNLGIIGYQFIILVKFLEVVPDANEIKRIFSNKPMVQFAIMTKGKYDLIIHFLAEDSYKATEFAWSLRTETILKGYKSEWNVSAFYRFYGFTPLRNDFIDTVVKSHLINSNDSTTIKQGILRKREFAIIKEFNANSRKAFSEIDESYNLGKGGAQYAYNKLIGSEIIRRPTITIQNLELQYLGVIILSYKEGTNIKKTINACFRDIISGSRYKYINKYVLAGDLGSPQGMIFVLPTMSMEDLSSISHELEKNIDGATFDTLIATDVVAGTVCYRLYDNSYSIPYKNLVDTKDIMPAKPTDYE
jgi:DNA-binding Lrp family transcriptional regulator